MKNQYFGDKRDLLKYSLLTTLADELQGIDQLSCIWLLTPPVANNDGNQHFGDGGGSLASFLRECVSSGRRDVRELARYMTSQQRGFVSYGDNDSLYFTAHARRTYFDSIPAYALTRSIVFFDPDNGLEPASIATAAHLKYRELESVFRRMDEQSIAVIYQHLPRRPPAVFWPYVASRLATEIGCSAGYVAEGHVGFLVLANPRRAHEVNQALRRFDSAWTGKLRIGEVSRRDD